MANPRQRSKARSHKAHGPSLNQKRRIHQKLKKTPTLKGPEVLQQGWDKRKTVFQNYAALGLLPTIPLPTRAGSRSYKASLPFLPPHLRSSSTALNDTADESNNAVAGPSVRNGASSAPKPKAGFGRIVRDDDGNIVDIIIDQDPATVDDVPREEGVSDEDEEADGRIKPVEGKTEVVKSLERIAATSAPVIRHSSTSERTWLQQLVDKYGDETERMSRDKALNVWQKTEGEIRRMIKKAGGANKLRS